VLAALVVVGIAVDAVVIAAPPVPGVRTADVVDVIGPPTPTRMAIADRLLAEGRAKALVVTAFGAWGPEGRSGLADCSQRRPYPVYCVTPDPLTTQGESRVLAALAARHGWRSATVVTQTSHALRADLIVSRCFPGRVGMAVDRAPIGASGWAWQAVYQAAGFVKLGVKSLVEQGSYCTVSGEQEVTAGG
jgi:hypothetical protein